MANELTDLDLGEWSICIDPANEDSTIEIVKSKSGLGPVLKETDMSDDNNLDTENVGEDADFEQFAEGVLEEFNALSPEDQADALVGLAADNAELEAAVEDATEVVKSLTENSVPKEKYEELKKSTLQLVEKMKSGAKADDEGDMLSRITKSLGGEDNIPDDVRETLTDLVKAKDAAELKDSVEKAKTYGFGKPEDVAGLETRIRKGKTTAADADLFADLVKRAGAVVAKSGLFKTVGEDAGNNDATSPIAKAKASLADIKKSNPGLTDAQAMTKYWADNPDEYVAHQAQRASAA